MSTELTAITTPNKSVVLAKLFAARRSTDEMRDTLLCGVLVRDFTNDELRVVADEMSIGETLMLRRLGLLQPDEGFDGRRGRGAS